MPALRYLISCPLTTRDLVSLRQGSELMGVTLTYDSNRQQRAQSLRFPS